MLFNTSWFAVKVPQINENPYKLTGQNCLLTHKNCEIFKRIEMMLLMLFYEYINSVITYQLICNVRLHSASLLGAQHAAVKDFQKYVDFAFPCFTPEQICTTQSGKTFLQKRYPQKKSRDFPQTCLLKQCCSWQKYSLLFSK